MLDKNTQNHLTVCKQMSSFKNVTYKLFTYKSYIHKKHDFTLNNLQRLICHKTQPN